MQLELRQAEPTAERLHAVASAMLHALGSTADASVASVSRSQLPSVAAALGKPERVQEVVESGTGWALAAAFERSSAVDKAVPVSEAAAWWAAEDAAEAITAHFAKVAFPGAQLAERQGSQLRFRLPPLEGLPLGELFARVEAARAEHGILSYAAGQVSLEDIFNTFAGAQDQERGHVRGLQASPAGAAAAPAPGGLAGATH